LSNNLMKTLAGIWCVLPFLFSACSPPEQATSSSQPVATGATQQLAEVAVNSPAPEQALAPLPEDATVSSPELNEIRPGIHHIRWFVPKGPLQPGPYTINLLQVDLSRPDIRARVVPAQDSLETTSSICRRSGAFAGINGGPFNEAGPVGLLVLDGEIIQRPPGDSSPRAALGLNKQTAWVDIVSASGENLAGRMEVPFFDWNMARYVLGAGPMLIRAGRVDISAEKEGFSAGEDYQPDVPMARSAVGIRGSILLLLTVDGNAPKRSIGFILEQAAGFLQSRSGAWYAMALEGGKSAAMFLDGQLISVPSAPGGQEQPVANAICIFAEDEVKN
jgi:hypothetical protein